jgi:hypothetical protein
MAFESWGRAMRDTCDTYFGNNRYARTRARVNGLILFSCHKCHGPCFPGFRLTWSHAERHPILPLNSSQPDVFDYFGRVKSMLFPLMNSRFAYVFSKAPLLISATGEKNPRVRPSPMTGPTGADLRSAPPSIGRGAASENPIVEGSVTGQGVSRASPRISKWVSWKLS